MLEPGANLTAIMPQVCDVPKEQVPSYCTGRREMGPEGPRGSLGMKKSSSQENGKELMDGSFHFTPLQEIQGNHTSSSAQPGFQGEKPPTLHGKKSCVLQTSQVHWLDRLLEYLVTAFLGKDRTFVSTFLHHYRTFATTQQVLDQLFLRYGCIFVYCEEDRGLQDWHRHLQSFVGAPPPLSTTDERTLEPEPGVNGTAITEFILLGLVETPGLLPDIFVFFLFAYLVVVGGNLSILAAILVEPKLHTPMYFFLGNLSVLDIGCITVTVPSMLGRLLTHKHAISYGACLTQLFFFHQLAGVDCFLLVAMAYDRFLGICWPLTYSTCMSLMVQRILVAVSWACAFTNALTHTVAISTLNFCGPNVINHFYCDLPQLFHLSCSCTHLNELLLFALGILMVGVPVILIVTSYIHVAAAVLQIHSAEGMKKAFSTCSSHLTVVGIFYGTGVFSYMRLGSVEASDKEKGTGILNTPTAPMLNPLIYSLQNPNMQGALCRVLMGK
ncbi:olfactory receptor 3A2-like [Sturnira hondurensis]|uniref:olfactory receptor 3A2-like n=1 Tax=Sturnira hondurensis TaxID=192404 RepID=UPI00187AA56C|nr:olfactory receptor 3A2-like [Sturnira hondurensis]